MSSGDQWHARELTDAQKEEATEQLVFIANQGELPSEQRQRSVGRAVVGALERVLNGAASAYAIWQAARPFVEGLFQTPPAV